MARIHLLGVRNSGSWTSLVSFSFPTSELIPHAIRWTAAIRRNRDSISIGGVAAMRKSPLSLMRARIDPDVVLAAVPLR